MAEHSPTSRAASSRSSAIFGAISILTLVCASETAFRVLMKEFPHLELRDLWPLWADRSSPEPVSIQNDSRKERGR